jgi:hypothetical protein
LFGKSGETFLPCIKAYKIAQIFSWYAEKYNLPLQVVGHRQGEKVHETLINETEVMRTEVRMIHDQKWFVIVPTHEQHIVNASQRPDFSCYDSSATCDTIDDLIPFMVAPTVNVPADIHADIPTDVRVKESDEAKIRYYIIHNCDPMRKERMDKQLARVGIPENDTLWMNHPNRDELTPELISTFVDSSASQMKKGQISCTYKHYMSMKHFLTTDADIAVIIEDNNQILEDVPTKMRAYLKELPEGWDACFDFGVRCCPYTEQPVVPDRLIYPKSNVFPGSTRCASFYFMSRSCVEKLVPLFSPVRIVVDWWLNELFRKIDARVFWVEPSNVTEWPHTSTALQ